MSSLKSLSYKELKSIQLPSIEDSKYYGELIDEIYRTQSDEYYFDTIKRAIIYYCRKEYSNPDNESVSFGSCDCLLRYVNENLQRRK